MKTILFAFSFLVAPFGKCCCQDLNWEELVAIAEKNNPDLHAARSEVESSQAKVRSVFSDFLPQLSGNGSYSKSNTATSLESVAQGGSRSDTQDEYALSLTAQQSLFSGFKTKANLSAAQAQLAGAKADLAILESRIFNDLQSAYIDVLHAQKNIKLLKEILDRKENNKNLIELRYQAGRENRGAFLRATAQLSQTQLELDQAGRSLRLAQKSLARALGQYPEDPYRMIGAFEVKMESAAPNFSMMATQTPQYHKNQSALAESRMGLVQARSDFFPSLSLSGTGRRRGDDLSLNKDSWSIGATISYPFFSGGRNFHGIRQAKAEINRAYSQLESQRLEIELALEDAFIKLYDAVAQIEIQNQFMEAAEERAKIARAQYNNGLISYQDWDIIENDLTNTEKQTLESLRKAALAESLWIQVQGKGLRSLQ